MKYLVLLSFISLGFADQGLLGTNECTYGPSYWCSHISKAQKCGAVQHCMDTVWKNQNIKSKDTVECSICKIGIEEAKNLLKQNGSEAKIEAYMKKVCDLMSQQIIKDECNSVVKNYLPIVLSLLKSNMTAEQICATFNLCTGFDDQVQHKGTPTKEVQLKSSADVCVDCKNFFTDVQNMIVSNETRSQLEQMLKQTVCAQLGPIQDTCNLLVDEFVPSCLQYMGMSVDPDTTCRLIGFCTNKDLLTAFRIRMQNLNLFKQFNKKAIGGEMECEVCKNVVTDVQALDRDPTTQDKIKDFIKTELCGKLADLSTECTDLVDKYASQLFELLANELDPQTVCSFIGFCRTGLKQKQTPGLVHVALTKTQSVKALSLLPAIQHSKPVKTSGVYCDVCKLAMTELDSMLAKNATKEQIEAALNSVCAKLPSGLSDECKAFIDQYAPAILELLQQELNPTIICDKLGLCTPLKKVTDVKLKANVSCVLCEFVLSELESVLGANRSRAAVEAALDKICSLMPDTISLECTAFVNQYAPLIIQLLLQEVQPKQVCKTLGLCSSKVKTLPQPVTGILLRGEPVSNKEKPLKNPEACLVCETLINYLDEALKENRTEAAIKSLLERACQVLKPLGDSWEQECEGIVIAFSDTIIKMLAQDIDPKQICQTIGLCTATKVNKELPKNPVAAIKDELKNVLMNRQRPVSNKLYFKPRTENLGKKKCGFGPSYWCKSMDTAKECDMVEHCKTFWSKNRA